MPEQDNELLLRVAADTAAAASNLQQLAQSQAQVAASVQQIAPAAQEAGRGIASLTGTVGALHRTFGEGQPVIKGFFGVLHELPAVLQETIGGIAAARFAFRELKAGVAEATDLLIGAARDFARFAEQVHNSSIQLGVSAEFIQAFRVHLQLIGQDAGTGSFAVRIFSRSIETAAEGTGKASALFQRLGVDVVDATGRLRPTEAVLFDTARALMGMHEGASRVALALQLFGRQGSLLLPIFEQMAHGPAAFTEELKKMGIVLSDEAIEGGRRFHEQWEKIGIAMEAQKRIWGSFLADVLHPFITGIADATGWLTRMEQRLVNFLYRTEVFKESGALQAMGQITKDQAIQITAAVGSLTEGEVVQVVRLLNSMEGATKETTEKILADIGQIIAQGPRLVENATKLMGTADLRKLLPADVQERLKDINLTAQQLQELVKVWSKADEESAAATAHEMERSKERIAGINALRDAELKAARDEISAKEIAAAMTAQLSRKEFEETPDFAKLQEERRAKEQAINQKYDDQAATLTFEQGQKILKINLDASKNEMLAHVSLDEEAIKQRRVRYEITAADEQTQLAAQEQKRLDIEIGFLAQELQTRKLGADEIAKINAQILDLLDKKVVKEAENATKTEEAQAKERESYRKTKDQIDDLYAKAFGSPQQARIRELITAQDKWLEQLRKAGAPDGDIAELNAAYAKMIADAKAGTIDLRDTIKTGIEDAFQGVILGTRKMGDVFKAFQESLVKSFAKGFADALIEKAGFDTKLHLNMTESVPESAAAGAGGFAKVFSSVFDLFATGRGIGTAATVTPSGSATWQGGTPPFANFLQSMFRGGASGGATVALNAGGIDLSRGGFISQAELGNLQELGVRIEAPSGATGAQIGNIGAAGAIAGGGAGSSLGGLLAGIGLLAGGAGGHGTVAGLTGLLGAGLTGAALFGPGIAAFGTTIGIGSALGAGATALTGSALGLGSALGGGIWGAALYLTAMGILRGVSDATRVGGAFGGTTLGQQALFGGAPALGLATVLGLNATESAWMQAAMTGGTSMVTGWITNALFPHIFSGPTLGTQISHAFAPLIAKAGIPAPPFGGGSANEFLKFAPNRDVWAAMQALGFGGASTRAQTGAMLAGVPGGPSNLESLRTGAALGLTSVLAPIGGPAGQTAGIAADQVNILINGMESLGISAKQARQYLLQLAQVQKVDLPNAVADLNKKFQMGTFTQTEYTAAIAGVIDLFGNLPAAINPASVALDSMDKFGTKTVVDLQMLQQTLKDIQAASAIVGSGLQSVINAVYPDDPTQAAARLQQQQDSLELHKANIAVLGTEIDQARIWGNEVLAAQLQVQKQSELAGLAAEESAAKILTPGQMLMNAVTLGIKKSIVDGVVAGVVQAGIIQAALAPVFAAIEGATTTLSDPKAKATDVAAAFTKIQTAVTAAGPSLNTAVANIGQIIAYLQPILSALNVTPGIVPVLNASAIGATPVAYPIGLQTGGIITRPTLAFLGERGPEAVVPLSGHGGSAAPTTIQFVFTGNTIMDEQGAERMAQGVMEHTLRHLKRYALVG